MIDLHGKRILVTGAAGFIGAFVAARLAHMGCQVAGCDNFNDYYSPQLKRDRISHLLQADAVKCDTVELADASQVQTLFASFRPELVVHLAAQAGVRYSLINPNAYIQSNLLAFANVLDACRQSCVEHLLYASSSSVYGAAAAVPFREDDKTDEPLSLYAATKKSNELLAHTYSHSYRLPATGMRFFTVYGPWGRPDMAYFSFAQKLIEEKPIPVFAHGQLRRDFTYIDDIVEGVVRLLAKPQPIDDRGAPHAVFNIGNSQPVPVVELVALLEQLFGKTACIEWLPMQAGDALETCADTTRLRDWVGYAPNTSLEQGLRRFHSWFIEWHRKRA